jgi:hypothetical protein
VDEAADNLRDSQAAVRILRAHKFTVEQVTPEGGTLISNPEGGIVRSIDIFVLKKDKHLSEGGNHASSG